MLLDSPLSLGADLSPLLAAVNALIQVPHALLHIVAKHVFLVDLGAASLDDLVADLGQETLHSLLGGVVSTQFPDDSDGAEHVWKQLWNLRGVSLLNLAAWLL